MVCSFKSLELFRHHGSSRVDKSLREYVEQSKASADQIFRTAFTVCFSSVISLLSVILSLALV